MGIYLPTYTYLRSCIRESDLIFSIADFLCRHYRGTGSRSAEPVGFQSTYLWIVPLLRTTKSLECATRQLDIGRPQCRYLPKPRATQSIRAANGMRDTFLEFYPEING